MVDVSVEEKLLERFPRLVALRRFMPEEEFLTLEEVARVLRCPEDVVYNWTRRQNREDRLRKVQIGKRVCFSKIDLAEFLERDNQ